MTVLSPPRKMLVIRMPSKNYLIFNHKNKGYGNLKNKYLLGNYYWDYVWATFHDKTFYVIMTPNWLPWQKIFFSFMIVKSTRICMRLKYFMPNTNWQDEFLIGKTSFTTIAYEAVSETIWKYDHTTYRVSWNISSFEQQTGLVTKTILSLKR